jgi:drug/metabolite transporter (DMT)-like permease
MMKTSASKQTTQGYVIAFVGTILWSTTAILIKYLNEEFDLPPLVLAFWRDALVAVTLFLYFGLLNRKLFKIEKANIGFLIGFGFVLSIYNAIWTLSVKFNGAAVSTVLVYSSSGVTALIERWLFGEKITSAKAIAIVISIFGIVFVSGAYDLIAWNVNFWGIVIGLLSGVFFAVYSIMGRETARREINSWTTLFYTFLCAAGFLFFYDMISNGTGLTEMSGRLLWLGDSTLGWGILIILAIIPTIGGYGLYTLSMRYLPATVANLIAATEPSMTAVEAYIFLDEKMTLPQIIGSLMIIFGVILLRTTETISSRRILKRKSLPPIE